jgi:hypothetical protein
VKGTWLPLVFCLVLLAAAMAWGYYLLPEWTEDKR